MALQGKTLLITRVKKNQLDAQLIISVFRQPLHVSGVSRPIIRRYNRLYTTIGTYYSFQVTICCPGNNSIEEEIKGRISLGNKAFYANQDLFKSKLLTKNSKLRMYKTLVRQTSGNICL